MTHTSASRGQNSLGKRVAKFFNYRRAKRLYGEINREMAFFESKFLKSRLHHA